MLDAERLIEAERVAQLQLAPQLFVTLMRRHSGLGPDMGKMREFHGGTGGTGSSRSSLHAAMKTFQMVAPDGHAGWSRGRPPTAAGRAGPLFAAGGCSRAARFFKQPGPQGACVIRLSDESLPRAPLYEPRPHI